jgi:hypothetical protein
MFSSQKILLDIATHRQHLKDERHMRLAPANVTTFEIGSYVLVEPHTNVGLGKPSGKFTPRLLGPYLVVNRSGDKYSCRNLVDDAVKDYHVTQLRSYRYDIKFMDPRDVALRDCGDIEIDKIVAHQGDITKLKTLTFRVKWYGFLEDDFDTWESWSNLRETSHLHLYLIANNMKQLIPKKFRENYPTEFPLKDKPTKSITVTGNTSRKRSRDADDTQEDQQPEKEAGGTKKRVRINNQVVVIRHYKKKPHTLGKHRKEKRFLI